MRKAGTRCVHRCVNRILSRALRFVYEGWVCSYILLVVLRKKTFSPACLTVLVRTTVDTDHAWYSRSQYIRWCYCSEYWGKLTLEFQCSYTSSRLNCFVQQRTRRGKQGRHPCGHSKMITGSIVGGDAVTLV